MCIINGLIGSAIGNFSEYSISVGYIALIPLLVHLDHFQEHKKWYDLLVAIIDFIFIVSFASRGPILCVATYVGLSVLFSPNLNIKRKAGLIIAVLLLSIILYVNLNSIINYFVNALSIIGRNSRTLRLLTSGLIGYDANRSVVYDYYIAKALKSYSFSVRS